MSIRAEMMLLTEAAKSVTDLPDDVVVRAEQYAGGIRVRFVGKDAPDKPHRGVPKGMIYAEHEQDCNNSYMVIESEATSGWGPLLYDIAMEYVWPKGITSDRESVSPDAKALWNYYLTRRKDVKKKRITNRSCIYDLGEFSEFTYHKKPRTIRAHPDRIVT